VWQQAPDGRVRHAFEPIVIVATLALIRVLVIESDVKSEGWQTPASRGPRASLAIAEVRGRG
jgi:hypothetical protein